MLCLVNKHDYIGGATSSTVLLNKWPLMFAMDGFPEAAGYQMYIGVYH